MKMTDKLKERFVRDCKIPIRLYTEPYFTERLELLDPFYDTIAKWTQFQEVVNKYPNEEEYFASYNATKEAAMEFIKSRDAYTAFNALDMNQFALTHKNLPSKDIFKPTFIGKTFISIDMKKANFNALKYYNASIFDGAETWEEFISKFTDCKYFIDSKYIREVIMGNCNPGRVITYEKHLTDMILTMLEDEGITLDKIVFFSNDEIVIDTSDMDRAAALKIAEKVQADAFVPLRIEDFSLRAVTKNGKIIGYIKVLTDGTYDFKCFNNLDLLFVLRLLKNEDIQESDLVFENEGYLAKYMEMPIIEIITRYEKKENN